MSNNIDDVKARKGHIWGNESNYSLMKYNIGKIKLSNEAGTSISYTVLD